MPSENVETEKKEKTNSIKELVTIILHQVNAISYDLYSFKMKSSQIQKEIQNILNIFQLNANKLELHNLDLKPKKEAYLEKMLKDMKLELKEVASIIAEIHKISKPGDQSPNITQPNLKQTCYKLRALENTLFYKHLKMKWYIKEQLAFRILQREAENMLNMCLQKNLIYTSSESPKINHDSSKLTPSLTDIISDINKMITNLSLSATTNKPADFSSKPVIFNDKKQPPSFNTQPTNIHRNKPQTELPNNIYIFGTQPKTSETSKVSQESSKYQPRLFKAFESKANFNNGTGKKQTNVSGSPKVYVFGSKPAADSVPTEAKQDSTIHFSTPISGDENYSEPQISNLPKSHKTPSIFRRKQNSSLFCNNFLQTLKASESKPNESCKSPENPGVLKFGVNPTTSERERRETEVKGKNEEFPSFEKNRAENGVINDDDGDSSQSSQNTSKIPQPNSNTNPETNTRNNQKRKINPQNDEKNSARDDSSNRNLTGTASVRFIPQAGVDSMDDSMVRYHYLTSMKKFENKSFEELRLEDYIADRKGPVVYVFKTPSYSQTKVFSLRRTTRQKCYNSFVFDDFQVPPSNFRAPTKNGDIPDLDTSTQNPESPKKSSETPLQKGASCSEYFHSPKDNPETQTNGDTSNIETKPTNGSRASQENVSAAMRLLKAGKNEEALKMCNDALELDPKDVYFLVLKAQALYELKKYKDALEEAQKVIGISPKGMPAALQSANVYIAKCCLVLGHIAAGEQAVRRALEHGMCYEGNRLYEAFKRLRSLQDEARQLMSECKYYDAIHVIDSGLKQYCPESSMMSLMKAECFAHTHKYEEARNIATVSSILSSNAESHGAVLADAMFVFGLCHYYQEHYDSAILKFRKVLEHDPDHKKSVDMLKLTKTRKNNKLIIEKKNEGNKAFNAGDWNRALKFYNEALSIDKNNKEENAKLHYNRATIFAKQNRLISSIDACSAAIELDNNYIKALLRRAQCYTDIEKYEEAFQDYEKVYDIDPTAENKRLLNDANKTLMANRGSYYYYKILGVSKSATQDQIKTAYRKCALRYHPDRHAGAAPADVRRNERKFKQVREAYDTLGELRARANYDRAQACYDNDSS